MIFQYHSRGHRKVVPKIEHGQMPNMSILKILLSKRSSFAENKDLKTVVVFEDDKRLMTISHVEISE